MIILKNNNHIDETKLDKIESMIFIEMLKHELQRHKLEMLMSNEHVYFLFPYHNPIVAKFWKCQSQNHQQDIDMIQKCIDYLVNKWGLK